MLKEKTERVMQEALADMFDILAYKVRNGAMTAQDMKAAVSDAVEDFMPEDQLHVLKKKIYSMLAGGHYDRDFAEETVADIYYVDRAGNVHRAPYWTKDTVMSVYEQVKSRIPNYNCWDFYVALNTVAADNWCMLNKWFPEMGEDERNDKLVEMTINWLDDPDNPYGNEKAWRYYNH